jgi:LacI family transcriptional regulator
VGFGDLPSLSSLAIPSLTTIAQDPEEIGRQAASSLLDAIENDSKRRVELRLPVRLVERDSVFAKASN